MVKPKSWLILITSSLIPWLIGKSFKVLGVWKLFICSCNSAILLSLSGHLAQVGGVNLDLISVITASNAFSLSLSRLLVLSQ